MFAASSSLAVVVGSSASPIPASISSGWTLPLRKLHWQTPCTRIILLRRWWWRRRPIAFNWTMVSVPRWATLDSVLLLTTLVLVVLREGLFFGSASAFLRSSPRELFSFCSCSMAWGVLGLRHGWRMIWGPRTGRPSAATSSALPGQPGTQGPQGTQLPGGRDNHVVAQPTGSNVVPMPRELSAQRFPGSAPHAPGISFTRRKPPTLGTSDRRHPPERLL